MSSDLETELDARIPVGLVLRAVDEFLSSAGWQLEFDGRLVPVPREPRPVVVSRAFVKAHAPDVFLGDHFEAVVALGPETVGRNMVPSAGTLRLYFTLDGKLVSEDRIPPPA